MRVAYVCTDPGVPIFGRKGSSIHVQSIVRALLQRGATVDLFGSRWDGSVPPEFADVRFHALPLPPKGDPAAREQALLAANDALTTALTNAGPFDLVYERYALWSCAGMEYARATDTPGLLEVNAPLIEEQTQHRDLIDRAGAQAMAKRVFGAATALLAVSDGVAAYLDRWAAARDKIVVVPNGVDPQRFPADLAPAIAAPDRFTVGFVGTLKPWHGLHTLIAAFALLHARDPHTRLLLVGDGPERDAIEADLVERGLRDATHFTGAVDPAEVPSLLRSMDVAVAPYPQIDNFYFSPLKVYEYMAAGVPVVASRIGQIDGVIDHERTGLLYPPSEIDALARALIRLRDDQTLRDRLGLAGRALVKRDHTWDAIAGRVLGYAKVGAATESVA